MRHPQVGPLELHYEKLLVPSAPGQTIVTYHARPGSESEDRLRLLAALDVDGGRHDGAQPSASETFPAE